MYDFLVEWFGEDAARQECIATSSQLLNNLTHRDPRWTTRTVSNCMRKDFKVTTADKATRNVASLSESGVPFSGIARWHVIPREAVLPNPVTD